MKRHEELSQSGTVRVTPEHHRAPAADRILTELHQVQRSQLERQNEELRRIRDELQTARERYFDLFELAPVSYLTLGIRGQILTANVAVTTLLGVDRPRLIGRLFSAFLAPTETYRFHSYLSEVLAEPGQKRWVELAVRRAQGTWP